MHYFFIVLYFFASFFAASDSQDISEYKNGGNIIKATLGTLGFQGSLGNNPTPSKIFYEKDENPVRIPTKIYEEHKKKKKKSPKRTIQKIIKKGKNRSRKIYVHPISRLPPVTSTKVIIIDKGSNEDVTTGNPRRRYRKNKVARYPMPFHNIQSRKDYTHHRNRREAENDEFYILKDFDEMEFLDKGKDYNVVKTQVKKYW